MRFNVGPFAYEVVVTDDHLEAEDGTSLLGLCQFVGRKILISSQVPRSERLEVLLHELGHAWHQHVPKPRTEEEHANLWATAMASAWRDLVSQGGEVAVQALEPSRPAAA